MKKRKKILYITHGLPPESYGGVEVYTRNLYKEFRKNSKSYDAFVLSRTQNNPYWCGLIYADYKDPNLFFINTPGSNLFDLTNNSLDDSFKEFLLNLNPDIIHFEHYLHLSLSWLEVAKNVCPNSKLILTVHEYLAMCPNSGQMITTKRNGSKLCNRSSPEACAKCFPHIPINILINREKNSKKYLSFPDLITGPSNFIKSRYVDYGIPENKFYVSENGQINSNHYKHKNKIISQGENINLIYIGQINRFKGLHILLEAMEMLKNQPVNLKIFGKLQDDFEYNALIMEKVSELSNVRFYGQYEQSDLPNILEDADAVVVPSIWWENSPLVIQESYMAGVPVICSNIGGMAEKVNDEVSGLHFRVGDAEDLTKKILILVNDKSLLKTITNKVPKVKTIEENRIELESIYDRLLDSRI